MKRETAAQLLNENLKNIFAFCVSNLFDKQDAEDLTNDIIVAVLSSVERLESDDAFYGYLWRIAENTLKKHIRKKNSRSVSSNNDIYGVNWSTPENRVIENEDIMTLRRELSLLSGQYRRVTVLYYIKNKTVSEISKELNISVEMVKYYLFKTRKILKEGIQMQRNLGEKSYNPGTFGVDFWGAGNNGYVWSTFERRLPGNIVLAAYEKPMTLWELSLELGVSAVYLEDELDILLDHNFIKEIGEKYQTNFIIFKEDYENEFREKVLSKIPRSDVIKSITDTIENAFEKYREKNFGVELDDNKLKWFIANYILFAFLEKSEEGLLWDIGSYPKLSEDAVGYVYGHDNNYIYGYFNGIYDWNSKKNSAHYRVINYNIIENCQLWRTKNGHCNDIICEAILGKDISSDEENLAFLIEKGVVLISDGKMKAEFPVITKKDKEEMDSDFACTIKSIENYATELCKGAEAILKKHVPRNLIEQCDILCYIRHKTDVAGILMEELVKIGYLTVPEEKCNLCFYGIK
ncbi:MAG: sigma-70 family RNA polymerase sigma factor [Clostridia bacterium]|nr:sigma-70 family RNA polymerase sigma factor [Clostridia bacterium]